MAKKLSIHLRKARIFMNILNRLAEDLHGEFGFATLPEENLESVIALAFKEQSDNIKRIQRQAKKKIADLAKDKSSSKSRAFKASPKHKEFWDKH